ncbi:MAG: hypothetical protein OZ948_02605 [Deltaproteobacteria bacterium]|nr:hypothetical protein [Deltaproteobacteria bacterium]
MSFRKLFAPATLMAGIFMASMPAFSGPVASGCRAGLDTNLDTKSDYGFEKTAGANPGLVNVRTIDGITQLGNGFPLVLNSNQSLVGYGSFDGTGRAQLLAINDAAPNEGLLRIIVLNGTALTSTNFPGTIPAGFTFVGVADMDNDDDDDIVSVKTTAPNVGLVRVTRMTNTFAVQGTTFPTTLPAGFEILGLADENGDGAADITAVKTAAPNVGLVRVFLMGADAGSIASNEFPGSVAAGFEAIGIGCFDADDIGDLLMVKTAAPNVGLVRVTKVASGAASFTGSTFPFTTPADYNIEAIGNYDGVDGDGLSARKQGAPNAGLTRLFNLTADASAVGNTGFPNAVSTEFSRAGGTGAGLP